MDEDLYNSVYFLRNAIGERWINWEESRRYQKVQ